MASPKQITAETVKDVGELYLNKDELATLLKTGLTPELMMSAVMIFAGIEASYSGKAAKKSALPTPREALQFALEFISEKYHSAPDFADRGCKLAVSLHQKALKSAKDKNETPPSCGETIRKALALKVMGEVTSTDAALSSADLLMNVIGEPFKWKTVDLSALMKGPLAEVTGPARPHIQE